ncbi:MAG TPA: CPBP family intramembrane glutamic endopeptidase [Candidatus Saccharimonadales bacterium]|nr:CPBP family intramembrane glutamic endopeptidase [Candidatus Saccharimonadales bacterium]
MSKESSKTNARWYEEPVTLAATQQPQTPRVSWSPAIAIVLTLLAFVAAQFAAAYLVGRAPQLFGVRTATLHQWANSVAGQFVYVLLAEFFTVGILWLYGRHRIRLAALGFRRSPKGIDAAAAALGFLVYLGAVLIATNLAAHFFHINLNQKQELGFDTVNGSAELLMVFASLVLLPPVVEELMFRGFLFSGLRAKAPFGVAALVTSFIFASLHLLEGQGGGLLWVAGIDTFVLSLVLCFVREKTGNLWAGIFIHMTKNTLAFLYLYVFVTH